MNAALFAKLFRRRLVLAGALILAAVALLALFAPWLTPYDPMALKILDRLQSPRAAHWFGTDELGRDVFSRVIFGARYSLLIGALVVADLEVCGVLLGLAAGFFRRLDGPVMRLVDAMMSFPDILLAIALVAVLGASMSNVILALAIVYTPRVARVVRASTLVVRELLFIEAARALGISTWRILFIHILQNIASPILVQATFIFAYAVLAEAGLSFLGVGVPPVLPTWGSMIASGQQFAHQAIWLVVFPASRSSWRRFRCRWSATAFATCSTPSCARRCERPRVAAAACCGSVHLHTQFATEAGLVRAVEDVSFTLDAGETLAVVGESGSGKSVTSLSIMGLIADPPGRIAGGEILFRTRAGPVVDLAELPAQALRKLRGRDIAMIFQEPMTSLNPVFSVGDQIAEAAVAASGHDAHAARRRALEMLELVEIPAARQRLGDYPHQLSGGMRQRVMIAMALACDPKLLIADEPTTALDVTIQAQILALLDKLRRDIGMAVLFITHNLGVVAEIADRVVVMYAGRVVEEADVRALFRAPRHPVHAGPARLPAAARARRRGARAEAAPERDRRPGGEPARPAARLRLRAALRPGAARVLGRDAAAGRRSPPAGARAACAGAHCCEHLERADAARAGPEEVLRPRATVRSAPSTMSASTSRRARCSAWSANRARARARSAARC